MKRITALLLFLLTITSHVQAEDKNSSELDKVFGPDRILESKYSVGKSVNVLDSSDLDILDPFRVTDSLSNIEGVRVKQTDGLGGLATVRIRGMRSIDTKVLLNGLPFRDPSDPQGSANPLYQDLLNPGFSRVEVIRGPGSTLWGSD